MTLYINIRFKTESSHSIDLTKKTESRWYSSAMNVTKQLGRGIYRLRSGSNSQNYETVQAILSLSYLELDQILQTGDLDTPSLNLSKSYIPYNVVP